MASSEEITKGQTALFCQLCENEPKIQWKCLECKLMMCQRCRDKVHPKFSSLSDHTIIDIKDSTTQVEESEVKRDFSKLKCQVHKGQNCCLFCKTCMNTVCPTCVAKTHKSHDLIEIEEGYEIQMENVKYFKKTIDSKIQDLSTGQKNLGQIRLTEHEKYHKTKKEICDQELAIVKAAKKCKDKLLHELDQSWNNFKKSIDLEIDHVKKTKKKLSEQNETVEGILQSADVHEILSSSKDLSSMKDENIEVKTIFTIIPSFVGGDLDAISLLFGSLDKTDKELAVQILDHFSTNLDHVLCMTICPDDTIWIGDGGTIQHVKLENHSTKVKSKLKIKHYDMALSPHGDLLITTGDSHLKLVQQGTRQIKLTHNISQEMGTHSVHVTSNNNIIVTATSKSGHFSNDGSTQVIIMDQVGKTVKVHEYDRNGKPMFNDPRRLCSNNINTIAVIDRISTGGRIIVLEPEGEVTNIYTGHPDVNKENNPFKPWDINVTHSGNFIIADSYNYTLHILDKIGNATTYLNTKKLIDSNPRSLVINKTNNLYIGTNAGESDGGKIFKTHISGW